MSTSPPRGMSSPILHDAPLPSDPSELARLSREVMADFLRSTRAYDVLPTSSRVLVLDADMPIQSALNALVENDVNAAIVFDTTIGALVDVFTFTDVCHILRTFHVPGTHATERALKTYTIASWRIFQKRKRQGDSGGGTTGTPGGAASVEAGKDVTVVASPDTAVDGRARRHVSFTDASDPTSGANSAAAAAYPGTPHGANDGRSGHDGGADVSHVGIDIEMAGTAPRSSPGEKEGHRPPQRPHHIESIHPEENLLVAVAKLQRDRVHHMPVVDPEGNTVLAILSYQDIAKYVIQRFTDPRPLFEQPLHTLELPSFKPNQVVTAPGSASMLSVLDLLVDRQISSIPLLATDGSDAVVDVYGRDDVAFLVLDPSWMALDAPVDEVRRTQLEWVSLQ